MKKKKDNSNKKIEKKKVEKDPYDEVMEQLKEYEEGFPPRDIEVED